MSKNVLILERSSKNLKKTGDGGKTVLEGVFAEFGVENRNGRVYEEKEYLPHLEYLKNDIKSGNLLGELDHPERFEVALGNVSHRISELWYDQGDRQIKGRIEILEGTPKGAIAKALLDSGIPLSISSRAAGTVNEDKTVSIQQIYTYDLVAKPGFESAQLKNINESAKARINGLVERLNESHNNFEKTNHNITNTLGIVNENISIYDLSDKFPQIELREEAQAISSISESISNPKKSDNTIMATNNDNQISETDMNQWTLFVKKELAKMNEKYTALESALLEGETGSGSEIPKLKKYLEKIRSIQEGSLQWQQDIAKAVNKLGTYSDKLAAKNNEHYKLTEKIIETVDFNAKTLNHHQDWTTKIAETVNATAETVDHNADMTDGLNEWVTEVAKGVNQLNEWGEEKAQAINTMHEWTSSIAKNVNQTANWAEDMFGRSMSKDNAMRLVEYIELIGDNKKDPELKKKLDEVLTSKGIDGASLSESKYFPEAITSVKKTGNVKVDVDAGKEKGAHFDGKIITAKAKSVKVGSNGLPKGLKVLDTATKDSCSPIGGGSGSTAKVKGIMTLDLTKSGGSGGLATATSGDGPTAKQVASQQLALDPKTGKQKLNENKNQFDVSSILKEKSGKLEDKLSLIVEGLEKEKATLNESKTNYPFVTLLSEQDQVKFSVISESDKKKVAKAIEDNPTNESANILNLWESAISEDGVQETPLFISAADEKYRKIYENLNENQKTAILAKSEFFVLDTQYRINDFWEKSGLAESYAPLNEAYATAISGETIKEVEVDSFVSEIGAAMRRYNVQ